VSSPRRVLGLEDVARLHDDRGAVAETDFDARKALGEELQRAFYEQVAMVNLGYVYRLVAKQGRVVDPYDNLALGNMTLHGIYLAD